jgi:hypothetical protein
MFRWIKIIWLILFTQCVAACSGSATPQLIASYPGGAQGLGYTAQPDGFVPTPALCSAFVEVEVSNLESAVGRASDLAASYGAYVTSLQSWTSNDRKLTSLTIVVPQAGLNSLRARLLELGSPRDDSLLGDPSYSSLAFCQISLTLTQRTVRLPSISWNPIHTLKHFALDLQLPGGWLYLDRRGGRAVRPDGAGRARPAAAPFEVSIVNKQTGESFLINIYGETAGLLQ